MGEFIINILSYLFLFGVTIFTAVLIYCMFFYDKLLREAAEIEVAKKKREAKNTQIVITFETESPKESPKKKSKDSEAGHIAMGSEQTSSNFSISYEAPPESADDGSWTWSSKHFE